MISEKLKEELENLFDYYETVMDFKFIELDYKLNENFNKIKLKHEQFRHNAGEFNSSINENIKS